MGEYKDLVMSDEEIREKLSEGEIEKVFDVRHYLRNVDKVFQRVFDEKSRG